MTDDVAFVQNRGGRIQVLGFEKDLSLLKESISFFPELGFLKHRPFVKKGTRWKKVLRVNEISCLNGAQKVKSSEIKAILFPKLVWGTKTRLVPLSEAETFLKVMETQHQELKVAVDDPFVIRKQFEVYRAVAEKTKGYELLLNKNVEKFPLSSVQSSKKIRVFHQVLTVSKIFGGVKRFLYGLLKNSDRSKFEHILCPHPLGGLPPQFKYLPIRIIQLSLAKYTVPHLKNLLLEEKIDVAHTCTWSHELAVAAKLAGIPHIWSIHGVLRRGMPNLPKRHCPDLLNLIPRLSERVVCASHFIKRQFDSPWRNASVIYNAIDFEEIDAALSHRPFIQNYNGDVRIAMLAHFIPQKRHVDLIRAAKSIVKIFPKVQFHMFGTAKRDHLSYYKAMQKTVHRWGLRQNFRFSYVPKNIYPILANMDILVLPSVDEGFGIAMIEGMALSKPVVAVQSGGIPEVVKDGETGILVPPKSPRKLADALIYLIEHPQRARRMGMRGRKRAEKFFDVKKMVLKYEEVFKKVTDKSD